MFNDYSNLSDTVERNYRAFLRVTNAELIILFWNLGLELNNHLKETNRSEYSTFVLQNLSDELVALGGPYFSRHNIEKMMHFATLIPDLSGVAQIAPLVSWEYVESLLRTDSLEVLLFGVKLAVEKKLDLNDLKKHINTEMIEEENLGEGKKEEKTPLTNLLNSKQFLTLFLSILSQPSSINPTIRNLFKNPQFTAFRVLITPKNNTTTFMKKNTENEKKLLQALFDKVNKYRERQNNWLNAHLNLFFLIWGNS